MFAAILLSALAANAAPTKRQALGNTPGELIKFDVTPDTPYSASSYCLATNLAGGALGDGTPLAFVDCHSVQTELPTGDLYGLWDIHYGNQESVRLVGTNYCIDAGSNPGSDTATPAKVWTCYPGLEQQQFYYTGTNHIAVTGSTPCLQFSQYDGTQFVQCGSNGDNAVQAFTLQSVGQQGMSSSMMPSPSSTMMPSPSSTMMPMPSSSSTAGKPIYWANGNSYSQCLTVTNGQFYDGSPVGIAKCNGGANQMWNYADYGVTSIQVAGQNFCIDFGTGGGSDGTPMKIWQCYPGLFQQTMFYTGTAHIAVYNGNQCLDVEAGTQNVQSWSCSGPDPNQLWSPTQAN